jgi:hypothetical protein
VDLISDALPFGWLWRADAINYTETSTPFEKAREAVQKSAGSHLPRLPTQHETGDQNGDAE